MNNQIEKRFAKCKTEKRAAFVAYITAGDPDFESSLKIVDKLVESGIDILELGVPFSDPLADGEANQLAAIRAIESGMTPWKVIELAKNIRDKYKDLPIVLFTYLNPIAYSGNFLRFCSKSKEAGINAILPLDMPPEEADDYKEGFSSAGLKIVRLIAPTSSEERINMLAKDADSFIYYVCQEGVTGERLEFAKGVDEKIATIKKQTDLPIVVGFGIATPEHVKAAASTGVDGVVVGSAIVRKVEAISKNEASLEDLGKFVKELTSSL